MNLSEGSSEHPLLRKSQIKGLAVGLVKRYPLHYNSPAFILARTELIVTQIASGRTNHPTN